MFCTKCGKKIPDDSVFCEFCGARVEQIQQTDRSSREAYQEQDPQPEERDDQKDRYEREDGDRGEDRYEWEDGDRGEDRYEREDGDRGEDRYQREDRHRGEDRYQREDRDQDYRRSSSGGTNKAVLFVAIGIGVVAILVSIAAIVMVKRGSHGPAVAGQEENLPLESREEGKGQEAAGEVKEPVSQETPVPTEVPVSTETPAPVQETPAPAQETPVPTQEVPQPPVTQEPVQVPLEEPVLVIPPATEMSTEERPSMEEFDWYPVVRNQGFWPEAVEITQFTEYCGVWKGLLVYDPDRVMDCYSRELMNVTIQGSEEQCEVLMSPYQLHLEGQPVFDESGLGPYVFHGSYRSEFDGIYMVGAGNLTLNNFYYYNGKEYAFCSIFAQDGTIGELLLVRP